MAKNTKEHIGDQISAIAEELGCKFTLKGESIKMEQVFSRQGLLPAIMRRADQLSSFCLGYGLGVSFERSDKGILGVTVSFDEKTAISLILLCAADVLVEIIHSAPSTDQIPLDELMLD